MSETTEKIIILGIGNTFMRDDALGVLCVNRLMEEYNWGENVELYDGGTTGMHGLMPIMEDADKLLVIDAINSDGEAGSLARYNFNEFKHSLPKKLSSHDVGLLECLTLAELSGFGPELVVIIGIKPEIVVMEGSELSGSVAASMDGLIELALKELKDIGVEPKPVARV